MNVVREMPPIAHSTSANHNTKKHLMSRSVGEELWEIHLARSSHVLDECGAFAPRKRIRSMGDELWEVHLKRSEGMVLAYDDGALPDGEAAHSLISSSTLNGVVSVSPDISAFNSNTDEEKP